MPCGFTKLCERRVKSKRTRSSAGFLLMEKGDVTFFELIKGVRVI